MTPSIIAFIALWIICIIAFIVGAMRVSRDDDDLLAEISAPFRDEYDASGVEFIFAATDEPLPTGWQGWEGGNDSPLLHCINPPMVIVMMRNGTILPPDDHNELCWSHFDFDLMGDIVAWRVAD